MIVAESIKPFGTYFLHGDYSTLHRLCVSLQSGWFSLRLAFVLRKLVLFLLRREVIDACIEDFKVRFYPRDNVTDRSFLFMPNSFDRPERTFLSQVLTANSIFLDIGANSGLYSLFASRHITSGRILAFEPHPTMAKRLEYNVHINELQDLIQVFKYGIADQEKTYSLSINPSNLGGNSIALSHRDKADYQKATVDVLCRPLLSVLKDNKIKKIDLLKIDIEEAEHMALIPFFEKGPHYLYPRHIIIESDDKIDLCAYGYKKMLSTKSNNTIYTLADHG